MTFLIVLLVCFFVVVGVISYNEHEYKVGTDYYNSLRLGDEG